MKNKKIIFFTTAIVSVVLVGILGLSKVFETSWQRENTVDNNLNAEIENISEDSYFDYPYIAINNLNSIDEIPSDILDIYYPEYISESILDSYRLKPKENMISFQEVANISGEFIKDSLGVTQHANQPAFIIYDEDEVGYPNYRCNYLLPAESYKEDCFLYTLMLDATTGKIVHLTSQEYFKKYLSLKKTEDLTFTKQDEENIIALVKDYLKMLGNEMNILEYGIKATDSTYYGSPIKYYTINIAFERNPIYYRMIIREENGFWLVSYGRKVDFAQ